MQKKPVEQVDKFIAGGNDIPYVPDNKSDITNDKNETSDTTGDITSDENINSDTNSYITSDINMIIKRRDKYTDLHTRKTYYIENVLLEEIDRLHEQNNLDKSYIVNEALRRFFNEIKGVK